MKKVQMFFGGMFCISGSLFASQGPKLSGANPIEKTGVYYATRTAVDCGLAVTPMTKPVAMATGVVSDYAGLSDRIAATGDRQFGKPMSDQAWDMMKFYDQHDMTEEMFDHDLQMRHSGCMIQ